MALNRNLNNFLSSVVWKKSTIIRLTNGLYTLVDVYSIIPDPDENLGTNLIGSIDWHCETEDSIIREFKLLGTWNDSNYHYNDDTGTWELWQTAL